MERERSSQRASPGGGGGSVQGHVPGLVAAAAAELREGPAGGGRRGHRRGPVNRELRELWERGLRRCSGARQRGGGGRSSGGTPGLVAGRVALWTGSARAVLALLLRVAHLHLLAVGSDSVLQRQGAILWGRKEVIQSLNREIKPNA